MGVPSREVASNLLGEGDDVARGVVGQKQVIPLPQFNDLLLGTVGRTTPDATRCALWGGEAKVTARSLDAHFDTNRLPVAAPPIDLLRHPRRLHVRQVSLLPANSNRCYFHYLLLVPLKPTAARRESSGSRSSVITAS